MPHWFGVRPPGRLARILSAIYTAGAEYSDGRDLVVDERRLQSLGNAGLGTAAEANVVQSPDSIAAVGTVVIVLSGL